MNPIIKSIEDEFRRYKTLAEKALAQVADEQLSAPGFGGGNSLATLGRHISGNLRSRFTDFLITDGEKPWRDRDGELEPRTVTRAQLLENWNEGWEALFTNLAELTDEDLTKSVTIRGQPLPVHEALHRSLAHVSYHVGQIVYLAHALVGTEWVYLSIPPGGSAAYNAEPKMERAQAYVAAVATQK